MNKWQTTIDVWPPTVNTIWRKHGSKTLLSKKARQFYQSAAWLIKIAMLSTKKTRYSKPVAVTLHFYPPTLQSYDLDNRAKAVLDAMVKGGLIADDSLVYELHLYKHNRTPARSGEVEIEVCQLHGSNAEAYQERITARK